MVLSLKNTICNSGASMVNMKMSDTSEMKILDVVHGQITRDKEKSSPVSKELAMLQPPRRGGLCIISMPEVY